MDQRHQEYVEYYRARLKKYEHNPLYPHSAAAEQAMFEAISTASSLEEFRSRVEQQQLPLRCAIALVRDENTAEANWYSERGETVRAQPHLEILRNLDQQQYADVQALTSMTSEVMTRWNLAISSDETLIVEFWNDWKILEDIEEYERAEVPDSWRGECQRRAAEELQSGAEHYHNVTLPETRKFFPDYVANYDLLWESRHRRKMPLADDIVSEKIAAHKRYRRLG